MQLDSLENVVFSPPLLLAPAHDAVAGAVNHNQLQDLQFLLFSHLLKTRVSADLVFNKLSWQRIKICLLSP